MRMDMRIEPTRPLTLKGRIQTLPLVDDDYSIGMWLAAADVRTDFFDLMSLSVLRQPTDDELPPYGSFARGVLELDYEFDRA